MICAHTANEKFGNETTKAKAFPIHRDCSEIDIYELLENTAKPNNILLEKMKMKMVYEKDEDGKGASFAMLEFDTNDDCTKAVNHLSGLELKGLTLIVQYQKPGKSFSNNNDDEKQNAFVNRSRWVYASNIDPKLSEQDLYKYLNSKVNNLTNFSFSNENILLRHRLKVDDKPGMVYIRLENNEQAVACRNALCGETIGDYRVYARLSKDRLQFDSSVHLRDTSKEICLSNIHGSVTNNELLTFCKENILNMKDEWIIDNKVWIDKRGFAKGMASIEFDNNEHASLAFDQLNGKKFKGLTVAVGFRDAKAMQKPLTFGQRKLLEKKHVKFEKKLANRQIQRMQKKKTKAAKLKKNNITVKNKKKNDFKSKKVSNAVKGKNGNVSKMGKILGVNRPNSNE